MEKKPSEGSMPAQSTGSVSALFEGPPVPSLEHTIKSQSAKPQLGAIA